MKKKHLLHDKDFERRCDAFLALYKESHTSRDKSIDVPGLLFWFQNFFLTYFRPSDTVFLVFEWETLY